MKKGFFRFPDGDEVIAPVQEETVATETTEEVSEETQAETEEVAPEQDAD